MSDLEKILITEELSIRLLTKKRELLERIYKEYQLALHRAQKSEGKVMAGTYKEYLLELSRRRAKKRRERRLLRERLRREAAAREEEGEKQGKAPAKRGEGKQSTRLPIGLHGTSSAHNADKKRASMVVHVGDMSFSFDPLNEEKDPALGSAAPEVKSVLAKMERLLMKLNK